MAVEAMEGREQPPKEKFKICDDQWMTLLTGSQAGDQPV